MSSSTAHFNDGRVAIPSMESALVPNIRLNPIASSTKSVNYTLALSTKKVISTMTTAATVSSMTRVVTDARLSTYHSISMNLWETSTTQTLIPNTTSTDSGSETNATAQTTATQSAKSSTKSNLIALNFGIGLCVPAFLGLAGLVLFNMHRCGIDCRYTGEEEGDMGIARMGPLGRRPPSP